MTHQCNLAFERNFKKARLFYAATSLLAALCIAFVMWKFFFYSPDVFGFALGAPVIVWAAATPVKYVKIAVKIFSESVEKICDWQIHNETEEKSWFDYHHVDALSLTKKDVEQIVGSKEITEPDLRRKHYIVSLVNSLAHHPANNVNKVIADAASELVSAAEKLISCSKKVLGELGWRKDFHEYFGYIVPNPMTTPKTEVLRFLPIVGKHLNRKAVVRNWSHVVYNLLERTRWEFADIKTKVRETPSAKDILAEVEDVKTSLENAARNLESNLFRELSIKAFDVVDPVNLPQKASDFIGFINRLP